MVKRLISWFINLFKKKVVIDGPTYLSILPISQSAIGVDGVDGIDGKMEIENLTSMHVGENYYKAYANLMRQSVNKRITENMLKEHLGAADARLEKTMLESLKEFENKRDVGN